MCLTLCIFWGVLLWRKIRFCRAAGAEEAAMLESLKSELGLNFRTRLLVSDEDVAPFCWLHTIVISKKDISDGLRDVLVHELAHVRLHHSADLLFSEMFIVTQWFNPFIYLMRRSLVLTHDYRADQAVLDYGSDKSEYQELLLKKSVGARYLQIANGFNKSNLQNRFIMMTNKKHFSAVWKSLLGLPVIALLTVLFSTPVSASGSVPSDSGQKSGQEMTVAQVKDTIVLNDTDAEAVPYNLVDQKPKFQGKESSAYAVWIKDHLQYPAEAKAKKLQGKVIVQFTIDEGGNLVNSKVLRSPNDLLTKEALRVVEESASIKWTPGYSEGKPVAVNYVFPILFALPKD